MAPRTYAPWGCIVRVVSQTKSRKYPPEKCPCNNLKDIVLLCAFFFRGQEEDGLLPSNWASRECKRYDVEDERECGVKGGEAKKDDKTGRMKCVGQGFVSTGST